MSNWAVNWNIWLVSLKESCFDAKKFLHAEQLWTIDCGHPQRSQLMVKAPVPLSAALTEGWFIGGNGSDAPKNLLYFCGMMLGCVQGSEIAHLEHHFSSRSGCSLHSPKPLQQLRHCWSLVFWGSLVCGQWCVSCWNVSGRGCGLGDFSSRLQMKPCLVQCCPTCVWVCKLALLESWAQALEGHFWNCEV